MFRISLQNIPLRISQIVIQMVCVCVYECINERETKGKRNAKLQEGEMRNGLVALLHLIKYKTMVKMYG